MQIIFWLLAAVVSLAISYLLRPKMKVSPQAASEQKPGEAEMPTVEQGDEIPVFFGTVWSRDAHLVWWGDTYIETRTYTETVSGGGGGGGKK